MNLTLDIAKEYLAIPPLDLFHLEQFRTIQDDAAEALAKHKGDLYLNGLETLSDNAAKSLAEHKGELQLDNLSMVSDTAAMALCRHEGVVSLNIDLLTMFSAEVADALSRHNEEWLQIGTASFCSELEGEVFCKLTRLDSYRAAELLASCSGDLHLDQCEHLSVEAAEELSRYRGERLYLGGLTTIPVEVARELAQCSCRLYLDGLKALDGLTVLTDELAEVLAGHVGDLSLNGLRTLSDKAAATLGKHKGHVSLDGLTTLSDKAAEALAGVWLMKWDDLPPQVTDEKELI